MFCPNCGVKLEQDQKFCTSCGSEFQDIPETPQLKEEVQTSPTIQPQSLPNSKPKLIPTYKKPSVKTKGEPGQYSKRCLVFSIISFVFLIIGVSIVGGNFLTNMLSFSYFSFSFSILRLVGLIAALVLHILGLVFGILSRRDSGRAGVEPINNLERVGSVVATFGIIFNAILFVVVIIILVFRFMPLFYLFALF